MANVTPEPTIYDQANLQQQLQGMAPIVSYYTEKANWEKAKRIQQMANEQAAAVALRAHGYAEDIQKQKMAGALAEEVAKQGIINSRSDLLAKNKAEAERQKAKEIGTTLIPMFAKQRSYERDAQAALDKIQGEKVRQANVWATQKVMSAFPDLAQTLKTEGYAATLRTLQKNGAAGAVQAANLADAYQMATQEFEKEYKPDVSVLGNYSRNTARATAIAAEIARVKTLNPLVMVPSEFDDTESPIPGPPQETEEQRRIREANAAAATKGGSAAPPIAANSTVPLPNGEVPGMLSDLVNSKYVQSPLDRARRNINAVGEGLGNALYNAKVGWFGGLPLPDAPTPVIAPALQSPAITAAQAQQLFSSPAPSIVPRNANPFGLVQPAPPPIVPYNFAPTALPVQTPVGIGATVPWAGPRLGAGPLTPDEQLIADWLQKQQAQGIPATASPIPVGP